MSRLQPMWNTFRDAIWPLVEALRDLLPIIVVILFFQEIVLNQPIPNLEELISGFIS